MTIYAHKPTNYHVLPKFRCVTCGFEHESCFLDRHGQNILNIYTARKRFVMAHTKDRPDCGGPFEYIEGVKKL
jgi:hypothetical protein